jgi:hypothetical protein
MEGGHLSEYQTLAVCLGRGGGEPAAVPAHNLDWKRQHGPVNNQRTRTH